MRRLAIPLELSDLLDPARDEKRKKGRAGIALPRPQFSSDPVPNLRALVGSPTGRALFILLARGKNKHLS